METQNSTNSGKTALVTGATSGIGRELATLFAKDGYKGCKSILRILCF